MDFIDPQHAAEIELAAQAKLEPGERLLWSGRPVGDYSAEVRKIWPISIFGLGFTAFALFWMCAAAGFRIPDVRQPMGWFHLIFPLFGLPFLSVGLLMLSSPLWAGFAAGWLMRRTVYGVTDRRAFAIQPFGGMVASWTKEQIGGSIQVSDRPDGTGDVVFSGVPKVGKLLPGLYGIESPHSVARLLR
jgi:hypothetical protein